MSDDDLDPAASTQMFQAYVDRVDEPDPTGARWLWPAVVAAVALVIVLVGGWLLLRG